MRSLRYWAGDITKGLGCVDRRNYNGGVADGYQRAQNINPSVGLRIKF